MQKALPSDGLGEANTSIKHVWIVQHISSSQTRGYQAYFALSVNSHRRQAKTGANPAQGGKLFLGLTYQTLLPAHTDTPKLYFITEVQILGLVCYENLKWDHKVVRGWIKS